MEVLLPLLPLLYNPPHHAFSMSHVLSRAEHPLQPTENPGACCPSPSHTPPPLHSHPTPFSPPLPTGEAPGNTEQAYFYNLETGESTWEMPDELAWDKLEDEANPGQFYYANKKTGDAQWEIPAAHGWQKVSDEL
jgi:hypothetical protein